MDTRDQFWPRGGMKPQTAVAGPGESYRVGLADSHVRTDR